MTEMIARRYLEDVSTALQQMPVHKIEVVVEILYHAYIMGRQVFIFGNGGSAATASHFCCDLGKGGAVEGRSRLRVLGLNDNMALLTAYANDMGYEFVFVEQMKNLVQKDDVVIGITASGNSPNVLRAIEFGNEVGAVTIGFLGFDGGQARHLVSENITLENQNYGQVEDLHMLLTHCISQCFRERVVNGEAYPLFGTGAEQTAGVFGDDASLMVGIPDLGRVPGLKGGRLG